MYISKVLNNEKNQQNRVKNEDDATKWWLIEIMNKEECIRYIIFDIFCPRTNAAIDSVYLDLLRTFADWTKRRIMIWEHTRCSRPRGCRATSISCNHWPRSHRKRLGLILVQKFEFPPSTFDDQKICLPWAYGHDRDWSNRWVLNRVSRRKGS